MSIEDRINGLVALAGSDNTNEARNAAHAACSLMRKHGLKVGGSVSAQSTHDLRAARLRIDQLERELQRARQQGERMRQDAERDYYQKARESAQQEKPPQARYVCITSKYAGYCNVCRKGCAEGDLIWWKRGAGARRTQCHKPGENDE